MMRKLSGWCSSAARRSAMLLSNGQFCMLSAQCSVLRRALNCCSGPALREGARDSLWKAEGRKRRADNRRRILNKAMIITITNTIGRFVSRAQLSIVCFD